MKRGPAPKGNVIFQSLMFKGELLVAPRIYVASQTLKAPKPTSFQWPEIMKNNNEKENRNGFSPPTLPKTNIAPENGWLEYYLPFGMAYFQVLC